jgi:hypothetical protein
MTNLRIDPDEFTLGDLEDFEDAAGVSFADAMKPRFVLDAYGEKKLDKSDHNRPVMEVQPTPRQLIVLVWLSKRREDPAFTLADARAIRVTDLNFSEDEAAEADPH